MFLCNNAEPRPARRAVIYRRHAWPPPRGDRSIPQQRESDRKESKKKLKTKKKLYPYLALPSLATASHPGWPLLHPFSREIKNPTSYNNLPSVTNVPSFRFFLPLISISCYALCPVSTCFALRYLPLRLTSPKNSKLNLKLPITAARDNH